MKKILSYLSLVCMLAAVALPMVACAPKSSDTGMEAAQQGTESMPEGAQQEEMGEGAQQEGMENMQQGMDEGQEGMQQGMDEAQQPASQM